MKLAELLDGLFSTADIPDREIVSVTENSRCADTGSVFVCIRGARADGHRYAADAYARGCRVFVAEKTLDLPSDTTVLICPDTRLALAHLTRTLCGDPSKKLHLIGITGTKGKTTTALFLAHLLNESGIDCGYIGSNGITYKDISLPTSNSTPDALTLQTTLKKMCDAGIKAAVIEVSSQALLQHRVDGLTFRTLLFTNFSPDHIGEHEHSSLAHYKACKHRLFTDFDADTVVFNADDPVSAEMLDGCRTSTRISCSTTDASADFFADSIGLFREQSRLGVSFELSAEHTRSSFTLPLIGTINVENALLAVAAANRVFDLTISMCAESLAHISVNGRSQVIPLPRAASAVIDYAHNAESLRQILNSLRQYAPSRLTVLFGSVGDRSQMRRRELGEIAAALADRAILTSDNPGHEDPMQIIDEIASAFPQNVPPVKISDRAKAIRYALTTVKEGEILLLAGKGHENYQLIRDEKRPFSERALIEEELQKIICR